MRAVAVLCIAIVAPTALMADSAVIPSQQVDFEFEVSVTSDLGVYEGSSRVRSSMVSARLLDAGPYVLMFQWSRWSDTEYSGEIEVIEADRGTWRGLDIDPIGFSGRFGETVELPHHLPEATLDLTATLSRSSSLVRNLDEYYGRPKSDYLAIATLALLLLGAFLFIRRLARKRGEKF